MSSRTLRWLALSYAVKTVLVGLAWLAIPDLPQRATEAARRVVASLSSPNEAGK